MNSCTLTTALAEDDSLETDIVALQQDLEHLRMQQGLVQLEVGKHAATLQQLLETNQSIMAQCAAIERRLQQLLMQCEAPNVPTVPSAAPETIAPSDMQKNIRMQLLHHNLPNIQVRQETIVRMEQILFAACDSNTLSRPGLIILALLLEAPNSTIRFCDIARTSRYSEGTLMQSRKPVYLLLQRAGIRAEWDAATKSFSLLTDASVLHTGHTSDVPNEVIELLIDTMSNKGFSTTLGIPNINPILVQILTAIWQAKVDHKDSIDLYQLSNQCGVPNFLRDRDNALFIRRIVGSTMNTTLPHPFKVLQFRP